MCGSIDTSQYDPLDNANPLSYTLFAWMLDMAGPGFNNFLRIQYVFLVSNRDIKSPYPLSADAHKGDLLGNSSQKL